jgi:hypothetical protein
MYSPAGKVDAGEARVEAGGAPVAGVAVAGLRLTPTSDNSS